VNHALYNRLHKITVTADLHGLEAMNAAASKITGATIDPTLYAAGKALRERSAAVRARLKTHYAGTSTEPTGTMTGLQVAWDVPGDPNTHHVGCICQRMYDEGRTLYNAPIRLQSGKIARYVDLDAWVANDLPKLLGSKIDADWFRQTYDAWAFGTGKPDPVLSKVKNRIEAQCPAEIHYPRLLADQLVGRDVYCSTDTEKENEAREGMEQDWFDQAHPWEVWQRTENRGSDSGAGSSDVLQRQREDKANEAQKGEDAVLTLSSDVETAVANAERKALRTIRRDGTVPSAWTKLVWANKRRSRSKDESARREIKRLLVKLDKYSDPATIGWVQNQRANGDSYTTIAAYIWDAYKSQLIRPKEVSVG
jgi:hypothetical protein